MKGHELDWESVHAGEVKHMVALPHYPFLKRRYWVAKSAPTSLRDTKNTLSYYVPHWVEQSLSHDEVRHKPSGLCLFSDDVALLLELRAQLVNVPVIQIQSQIAEDSKGLFQFLTSLEHTISHVVFARCFNNGADAEQIERSLREQVLFVQTLMQYQNETVPVIGINLFDYPGEGIYPGAVFTAFAKSIRQEYPLYHLHCLGLDSNQDIKFSARFLLAELTQKDINVRYVGSKREVKRYKLFDPKNTKIPAVWKAIACI